MWSPRATWAGPTIRAVNSGREGEAPAEPRRVPRARALTRQCERVTRGPPQFDRPRSLAAPSDRQWHLAKVRLWRTGQVLHRGS